MLAPFRDQHADHAERNVLDAHLCPIGIGVRKELPTSVWPITQTLVAPEMSPFAEEIAARQGPVAHDRIIDADAEQLVRLPVELPPMTWPLVPDERRRRQHRGALCRDGAAVRRGQRRHRALTHAGGLTARAGR